MVFSGVFLFGVVVVVGLLLSLVFFAPEALQKIFCTEEVGDAGGTQ